MSIGIRSHRQPDEMPQRDNDVNCSVVKQLSINTHRHQQLHRNYDADLTKTAIANNIEENRRRRAELANDVSELINISRFFQQSYANGYDILTDASALPVARNATSKRHKAPANGKSMALKLNKSATTTATTTTATTARSRRGIAEKLNNARTAGAANDNNNNRNSSDDHNKMHTIVDVRAPCDGVPPVFDHDKLNGYCIDIVEQYFQKAKTSATANDHNIKSRTKSAECERHSNGVTVHESRSDATTQPMKVRNNRYASVSARYMHTASSYRRACDRPPPKVVRNSWVSARSMEILENAHRNGVVETKKHNCLVQETQNGRTLGSAKKKLQTQNSNRSLDTFQRIHPDIELIASASICPRRAIKLRDAVSCGSIDGDLKSNRSCQVDARVQPIVVQDDEVQTSMANDDDDNNDGGEQCGDVKQSIRTMQPPDRRSNLQLYTMPKITIAPQTKCEISKLVTIDIQPNDSARSHQQNNLKMVHCVHTAATASADDIRDQEKISIDGVRQQSTVNHDDLSKQTFNKYYELCDNDSNDGQPVPSYTKLLNDNKTLHRETSSSLIGSVSVNLSTASLLSDTFDFDVAHRKRPINVRHSVESILNDIFENSTQTDNVTDEHIANDSMQIQENHISPRNNSDALQLRDLLNKIRDDKTCLQLAIERQNVTDSVDRCRNVTGQSEIAVVALDSSKPNVSDAVDKSIQCNTLDELPQRTDSGDRMSKRKSKCKSKTKVNELSEIVMRSPKFTRTVNSIRSSARKLNFDSENGQYKAATPEQIKNAADKFLNSLIKNDDSDSDSLNSYILAPPKYRVVKDKIIQSQHHLTELTSDNTIDSMHRRQTVRSSDDINDSTSSCSIDLRLSNLNLKQHKMHQTMSQEDVFVRGASNGNISDGEVLSEGEIRPQTHTQSNS